MASTSTIKNVFLYTFLSVCIIGIIVFDVIKITQLSNTQDELATTQSTLASTQSTLSDTEATLADTDTEIYQTQDDLLAAQADLSDAEKEYWYLTAKLKDATSQLAQTQADYQNALTALDTENALANTLQSDFSTLQTSYNSMTAGYAYVYRDPSWQELKDFLAADTTDANTYIPGVYVCENFSMDVKARAMQQKIHCAYVHVFLRGEVDHAIVAFYTSDRDLVFIEPQTDEEVDLQVGKHYWSQCVIPAPGSGSYNNPTVYDDTIVRFLIIW
jgi:hypothetical protein